MASPARIIFYDIPTKPPASGWTPNPWKTRILLNYKNLPYQTQWVEYPDIAANAKRLGIKATPQAHGWKSTPHEGYTCPAVTLPAIPGHPELSLQDSAAIAQELEKRYPTPSAHLDSPYVPRLAAALGPVQNATRPLWMPLVPRHLLSPASADYFRRTRNDALGKTLDEYEAQDGGEPAWRNAEPGLAAVAAMLGEHAGPFFEGERPTYADFILATMLHFWKLLEPQALFGRVTAAHPPMLALYEACAPWLQRAD